MKKESNKENNTEMKTGNTAVGRKNGLRRAGRYICAALAALMLTGLSACSGGLVSLEYRDGRFVNDREGLSYVPASLAYGPTVQGEAYAYYKNGNITLYTVGDSDARLWLTEEYGGGATTVFHAASITLPTLREFGAEKIIVCQSDTVTAGICEITDGDLIEKTISLYTEGEACEWPLTDSVRRYELKFCSPAWPQIYMNLIYGEFPDGKYLYERESGRCVEIGDLLAEYID